MFHMAYQAKLRSFRLAPKYKYQFEILQDYKHVVELNEKHGTTKWFDATKLEMVQLDDYDCFRCWTISFKGILEMEGISL